MKLKYILGHLANQTTRYCKLYMASPLMIIPIEYIFQKNSIEIDDYPHRAYTSKEFYRVAER